jgi:hypothetical protein
VTLNDAGSEHCRGVSRLANQRSPVSMGANEITPAGTALTPRWAKRGAPGATNQGVDPTGQIAADAALIAGSI